MNTMTTVADAEALIDLLHDLNERGVVPSVAFIDVQGITGVAYGIDQGDEMGIAFLSDPGEDRVQYDLHSEDDASYIGLFERDVHELHGPITVLHESGDRSLAEQGRRLASQRDDLIAAGVDPSQLEIPLHPGPNGEEQP